MGSYLFEKANIFKILITNMSEAGWGERIRTSAIRARAACSIARRLPGAVKTAGVSFLYFYVFKTICWNKNNFT